jgi:CDP-glucose 4,6-dehydratase
MFEEFFRDKSVFVTGHTGFKGSWLCLWLHSLGAAVTGYALDPPTEPSLFKLCRIGEVVSSVIADVRDCKKLSAAMEAAQPEIVIHMAAQPLVRESYNIPAETFDINVMGTVNLFEAVKKCKSVKAVINVTTDKCYENKEWIWGYRECEPLGGYDPYSSSKTCSELVTVAYRNSFFHQDKYATHGVGLATARAGNVIGGGDWAADRLVPDSVRALLQGERVIIRNPRSIRPWQHVLEPLYGYLLLARLLSDEGWRYAQAWNLGPDDSGVKTVEWLVKELCSRWGRGASYVIDTGEHPHEAACLKLDCSKARQDLSWRPQWTLEKAVDSIVEWTHAYEKGSDVRDVCVKQIREYTAGLAGG